MSHLPAFPHLFQPFEAGRLKLKNRLVVLAHGTNMVRDGAVTPDNIAYWETRARSGVAMVITGGAIVHASSAIRGRMLVEAYDERVAQGLRARAGAMRAHGVTLIGQLLHFGREMPGPGFAAPLAPSSSRSATDAAPAHELTVHEIQGLVSAFARTAANYQSAGHDGAEIHAAHGYLIAQFLSPASNHRTDAYGGTPEKRLRFLREVIEAVRARCGNDFAVGVRLSADEETPRGNQVADTVGMAQAIAGYGAVDYLNITAGVRGNYVKDASTPHGVTAPAAKRIREASGLPVIVGQRITTPQLAQQILEDGAADLIGMARALIADPDWVRKAAEGQADRIRPCIAINQDCRAFSPHLHCAVNPAVGREARIEFSTLGRARAKRRVAVIGAGPAGLEAARVAAARGHSVTVFDAAPRIGGQFFYAGSIPGREELQGLIGYERGELERSGVKIELQARIANPGDLGAAYDVAIAATGAAARPLPKALEGVNALTAHDVFVHGAPALRGQGRAVLVDDGGGFWLTYGAAEILVQGGWQVLMASPGASIARGIPAESVGPLLKRLGRAGTEYRVLTSLARVEGARAHLLNIHSAAEEAVACDLLVMQTGRVSVALPLDAFRDAGMETHAIGDCIAPRRISQALLEGYECARQL